jgi:hypothetical protein
VSTSAAVSYGNIMNTFVKFIAPVNNTHIYNENCRVYVKRLGRMESKNLETNIDVQNVKKTNR